MIAWDATSYSGETFRRDVQPWHGYSSLDSSMACSGVLLFAKYLWVLGFLSWLELWREFWIVYPFYQLYRICVDLVTLSFVLLVQSSWCFGPGAKPLKTNLMVPIAVTSVTSFPKWSHPDLLVQPPVKQQPSSSLQEAKSRKRTSARSITSGRVRRRKYKRGRRLKKRRMKIFNFIWMSVTKRWHCPEWRLWRSSIS